MEAVLSQQQNLQEAFGNQLCFPMPFQMPQEGNQQPVMMPLFMPIAGNQQGDAYVNNLLNYAVNMPQGNKAQFGQVQEALRLYIQKLYLSTLPKISFRSIEREYERLSNLSPKSKRTYKTIYARFINWMDEHYPSIHYMTQVSEEIAHKYGAYICKSISTGTEDLQHLKAVWGRLLRLDKYQNPWYLDYKTFDKKLKDFPQRGRRLSTEEVLTILNQIYKEYGDRKAYEAIHKESRGNITADLMIDFADGVIFMYSTGMRPCSIADIKWGDLEEHEPYLTHYPPKTRKRMKSPLTIPISTDMRKVIMRRYRKLISSGEYPKPKDYLFPHFHNLYAHSDANLSAAFRAVCEKAGVDDTKLGHACQASFRRTFESLLTEGNISKEIIDSIQGHSPQNLHENYTSISPRIQMKAVRQSVPKLNFTLFDDVVQENLPQKYRDYLYPDVFQDEYEALLKQMQNKDIVSEGLV